MALAGWVGDSARELFWKAMAPLTPFVARQRVAGLDQCRLHAQLKPCNRARGLMQINEEEENSVLICRVLKLGTPQRTPQPSWPLTRSQRVSVEVACSNARHLLVLIFIRGLTLSSSAPSIWFPMLHHPSWLWSLLESVMGSIPVGVHSKFRRLCFQLRGVDQHPTVYILLRILGAESVTQPVGVWNILTRCLSAFRLFAYKSKIMIFEFTFPQELVYFSASFSCSQILICVISSFARNHSFKYQYNKIDTRFTN